MTLIPYDDRDGFIWMDGHLVPWRDAKVHVLSHSLHYSGSIYEGIRVYNGHPFKLTEHIQRLEKSASLLGYKLPYSREEIDHACREVVASSGLTNCYIRPIAWRGSKMMGISARSVKIHIAIAVWEWKRYFTLEAREKGLKLITSHWRRPPPNTAPVHSKTSGLYTISTLAKHAAEEAGYHDALMLDWRGQIAEATGANIFLVINDKLHTPLPDCFLNGITRQTIITLAQARGIEVIERAVFPNEIMQASEAFLTGTAAELSSIGQIDQHVFGATRLARTLQEDYERLTHGS